MDVYFSADIEADGPIPGPYSMLSFGLVGAGCFDGHTYEPPKAFDQTFYRELKPISDDFREEARRVSGLDRERLKIEGKDPEDAMTEASHWVREIAGTGHPILVAFPLSFDWTWLYWYFVRYARGGSPFSHAGCFDIRTAYAAKAAVPISDVSRSSMEPSLLPEDKHTHHALDDAIEQAKIFANLFTWAGIKSVR